MNKRGQFSIIAALLVSIILISTVMVTYNIILNNTIQVQPQVLTAIDETNFAIKQLLGFSVGYYGSVIQVSGDTSYANQSTVNYTSSGLEYIANTHPDWGAGFNLANLTISTYWFNNTSYSTGYLDVTYNLTKLGIYGMQYAPSCGLTVQIVNITQSDQTSLIVSQDQDEPVTNLEAQNFEFYQYEANSTWVLIPPSASPIVFTNGTYQIQPPTGIDVKSYVIQVTDQRGIAVVASPYSSYNINMTWPTLSPATSSPYYYVNNNASDVDCNGNIGTESNFTAQQYGPDNIYDTLAEAKTDVVAYIPITLTNIQSSATPNPFQEEITWNPSSYSSYEASNLGNIRFYNDSDLTTPLYAWLESCTPSLSNTATNAKAWIKLTSPIAANGGTFTIYMAFLSTNTTYDDNFWGDAPNLSGTYGAYDNGANVFNAYFNGNTATSSFSVYSGYTLSQATGISGPGGTTINAINAIGYSGNNPVFAFNKAISNTALIVESSFWSPGSVSPGTDTGAVGLVDNAAASSVTNAISANAGYGVAYFDQDYEISGAVTVNMNHQGTSTSSWLYATLTYTGSGASSWNAYIAPQLYSSTGGYSGTVSNNPLSSASNLYLGQVSATGSAWPVNIYYNFVRARAYPPGNVMPSASFGSVTSPNTNYRLDIEEQWTNVNYWASNASLDIFTGPFFSPTDTLSVQCWNATNGSWLPLISSLNSSSWNNVSVTTYLAGSTFTIRFLSGTQTDIVQNSWQIDATLLFLNGTLQAAPPSDSITVELLQNGTMRWLGQNLQLTTQTLPIPPLPVKSIHVNETISGLDSQAPFQIEDWASNYMIPLGLTSNASVFNSGNMIVFLANSNVSSVTVWWNGSDLATQTPYAYVDNYFNGDNTAAGILTNGILSLQFNGNFHIVSTVGSTSCTATFMRIDGDSSIYGASPAYVIANGVVRDIVQQEAEWTNGVPNCPNIYSHEVITLPANSTYYTYELRVLFVQSQQSRNINDLCPIELQSSITQTQTENGTSNDYPIVSTTPGTFYNLTAIWQHHWSQFISGNNGAGIMFTDTGNSELYSLDSLAGTQTGELRVNQGARTIELLPIEIAPVSLPNASNMIWWGAVSTFSNTTPIYQNINGQISGSWTNVEYPPTATVYTGN